VGAGERNLEFDTFALGNSPEAMGHFVRTGETRAETRSHGFFYLPSGDRDGVLGLPTSSTMQSMSIRTGVGTSRVEFLRVEGLRLRSAGSLDGSASYGTVDDGCRTSCDDWYGNARPIFYQDRVFALMGYELVEGRFDGDVVMERHRVN